MASKREQCKSCKMGCTDSIYKIKINTARIPFDKCLDYTPKQTNADRIRAMTDEELAEFLTGLNEHCLAGIGKIDCSSCNGYCEDNCRRMTRKWLQSEAE